VEDPFCKLSQISDNTIDHMGAELLSDTLSNNTALKELNVSRHVLCVMMM